MSYHSTFLNIEKYASLDQQSIDVGKPISLIWECVCSYMQLCFKTYIHNNFQYVQLNFGSYFKSVTNFSDAHGIAIYMLYIFMRCSFILWRFSCFRLFKIRKTHQIWRLYIYINLLRLVRYVIFENCWFNYSLYKLFYLWVHKNIETACASHKHAFKSREFYEVAMRTRSEILLVKCLHIRIWGASGYQEDHNWPCLITRGFRHSLTHHIICLWHTSILSVKLGQLDNVTKVWALLVVIYIFWKLPK